VSAEDNSAERRRFTSVGSLSALLGCLQFFLCFLPRLAVNQWRASVFLYQSNRNRIIETLTSCKIEPRDGAPEILLEDLAIYLFAVENRSFSIADHPRRQWTCNYDFVSKMFSSLKSVTGRGGANRNKLKAIRDILEPAGLIECLDRGYVATGHTGVCQKWVVGDRHPRFVEWVRFADDLRFEKVLSGREVRVWNPVDRELVNAAFTIDHTDRPAARRIKT
jgi:hypothetical protein